MAIWRDRNRAIDQALKDVVEITKITGEDEKKAVRRVLEILESQGFSRGIS